MVLMASIILVGYKQMIDINRSTLAIHPSSMHARHESPFMDWTEKIKKTQ